MKISSRHVVIAACTLLGATPDALAQSASSTTAVDSEAVSTEESSNPENEGAQPSTDDDAQKEGDDDSRGVDLETLVITGVGGRPKTQLDSSVSVSDLSMNEIRDFTPRSTAEIFRNIPGIRSESSGGENNANIQVRGLPVTTGGAKFVQLQEDGLPVLGFGDITFGNADNFLRFDYNVRRIEAIRGGSASTFASNAPGAVINFISRTGAIAGGEIGVTRGIDFDTSRVDFRYGSPIFDDWQFHIGGFYRAGEGVRETGYTAEEGGQIKANLTRNFDSGFVRVHFKHLNDRTIPYLPSPVLVEGGEVKPIPGFDFRHQALASRHLLNNVRINSNRELGNSSITDGVRSVSNSVGLEMEFDFAENWKVTNRGRYSANSGGFVGSFADGVTDANAAAAALGGTLSYFNGPNAGQALQGNPLLVNNLLFDVNVEDLSHFVNEVRLSRKIDTDFGNFDVSVGYYKSIQQVETEWSFNRYLQEARGENAALISVVDGNGVTQTVNGVTQFGVFDPFFDLDFNRDAVFGALSYSPFDGLTIEASVRYDIMNGTGSSNLGDPNGNRASVVNTDDNMDGVVNGAEADFDVNNDGRITLAETSDENNSFGVVDRSDLFAIDYTVDYVSYSFGANFEFIDGLAAFARYSQGAVANADRLLLGPQAFNAAGNLVDEDSGVDFVRQAEVGVKLQNNERVIPGILALFVTGFFADSEENNFEITSGRSFDRTVQSYGVEIETSYQFGPFYFGGGVTVTNAEISKDGNTPENVGNRPRRQAVAIYQATAAWYDYLWDRDYSLGFNVVGTTGSYSQDSNEFEMPGFAQVNLFANIEILPQTTLSFNANNLFNAFGLTEVEEGAVPENGIVRGRPINGRSMSLSLRHQF